MNYLNISTNTKTLDLISFVLGSLVSFLFGGWNDLIIFLIVLNILDMVTAIWAVVSKGKKYTISSNRMTQGITKKGGFYVVIILAHVLDVAILKDGTVIRDGAIIMYLATEGLSITENLDKMGVPIPSAVRKYLKSVQDEEDTASLEVGKAPANEIVDNVIIEKGDSVQVFTKEDSGNSTIDTEDTEE